MSPRWLFLAAAALAAGCATDPTAVAQDRDRMDREYRTGSNFPKGRESGVSTYSREAVVREQQVGAPGATPTPFGSSR